MTDVSKKTILVIEDEKHIAEGIELNLKREGYDVKVASDGVTALEMWQYLRPDLIVLDLMLPKLDGYSVLKHIRKYNQQIPILILSAKDRQSDKIQGLSLGVDDYLTKPFNLDEFLLRISRLLIKSSWYREDEKTIKNFNFGNNHIDFERARAQVKNGIINLTEQEMKLLKIFIVYQGKTLSREKLLKLGCGQSADVETRTVDNFVVRFRRYFEEDPKNPVFFRSIRSVGYLFEV